jgi:regulatory protein YycI of two-component signal transduction system YycFG
VIEVGRTGSVKKLFILVLLVLGVFAVWRKVQAQRADLDLWSEATAPDDY